MRKERIVDPIVCDVLGCGNLAKFKITFCRTGTSLLVCEDCMKELKDRHRALRKTVEGFPERQSCDGRGG